MMHHRSRFLLGTARAVSFAAVLGGLVATGCSSKKTAVVRAPDDGAARDSEAAALATLEAHPDLEVIKAAVQQLDGLDSAALRPVWAETDRAELAGLLRLTDVETADLGQRTFTPADVAYIEECLVVRAGLRALNLDRRPPAERGALAFDWVCRTAFVDPRIPTPAPPWDTLQGGCGVVLSRAYAVLAAWRQVGLDGCLVGPPGLKDTPALDLRTVRPESTVAYAPVRACGLKVGPDVLLFDPAGGKPIPAADGKGVLTLAAARATPAATKGVADDSEAKTWQPFLAPPLTALTKRMEWLQELNPGNGNAKVFVDVRVEIARFKAAGGETPVVWNAPNDRFSPGRITARYAYEDPTEAGPFKAIRDRHRRRLVPDELMPLNKLDGNAQGLVQEAFRRWYDRFWSTPGSPRDLYVRGNLADALSALTEIGSEITTLKARVQQDPSLRADFNQYFADLFALSADRERAKAGGPDEYAAANQRFIAFVNLPKNRDVERAYTLGTAHRPLGADVLFLTAACVHERAERAQLDGGADAAAGWRNAAECWDRFLNDAPATRTAFPGREPHARAQKARCLTFLPK